MAKDEEAPKEQEQPAKKGSKKMLIIIIVVVVLVVGGGLGAFLALGGKSKGGTAAEEEKAGAESEGGEEKTEAAGEGEVPGAVLALEPFIVNLQVKGSFLKATIQLQLATQGAPKAVEADIPMIRDSIIGILSSKSATEILAKEGKDKLRKEIKQAVNHTLGSEEVDKVFFTEFIIQ